MATQAPKIGAAQGSMALRGYVLVIMMLIYAISIADRYVMSTVLEQIRRELKLTDSGVALLTGVSLAFFYVIAGLPLSWVADRFSRRNLLAASIATWSVMTILCGKSYDYLSLLLPRIGVGIGEAGGTPACGSIVADTFPIAWRPMAMTIFALGAPIGAWMGAQMAGDIANLYGWRAAFLVLGVPGLVMAAIIMVTIREPERGCLDRVEAETRPSTLASLAFLWEQKAAFHLIMAGGVTCLWGWGLMWFVPTYLQRMFHMSVGQAGDLVGQINLWMGIGASLLAAAALGMKTFQDPRRILLALAVLVAASTIPSIIAFATNSPSLCQSMLWLFVPTAYLYIGPTMAILQNTAPASMRALFVAISLLVANVFNLIVAPQGVGLISDYVAPHHVANAESLRFALLILAPTGLWGAFHYVMAARTIITDQQRAVGTM